MAPTRSSRLAPAFAASVLVVLLGASSVLFGVCGPFTDTANDSFCPFVLEVFYLGITTGTTPTTYDPTSSVTRLQMAAFLSRSVDGVLKRGGRRAAVNQFWTTQGGSSLGVTTLFAGSFDVRYDGADVWVSNDGNNTVSRVRTSDGRLLETWTGAVNPRCLLVAMGRVFVAANTSPGNLYQIVPSGSAGAVTTVTSGLGNLADGIAFDGARIWTANIGASVSIVTPGASIPWSVTNVSAGFSQPLGILYDGANIWTTDFNFGTLLKLNSAGAILQTVTVGAHPRFPVFDGGNIWVPNALDASVSVVRASTGAVLATLTGNGLVNPLNAAFDGQRVLVTNSGGDSVSLWKAADLTTIGTFPMGTGTNPRGVCSDGTNFWIARSDDLARF